MGDFATSSAKPYPVVQLPLWKSPATSQIPKRLHIYSRAKSIYSYSLPIGDLDRHDSLYMVIFLLLYRATQSVQSHPYGPESR